MKMLAGDIGGTKTHLSLVDENQPKKILKQKTYSSQSYSSLDDIVIDFLLEEKAISLASFGVAGPVENGKCRATNLPWIIDAQVLSQKVGISTVHLINDLEANAWGIASVDPEKIMTLNQGTCGVKGNQALIAAGTGLGEAGLYFDGHQYHPFASEGGHCDFSPLDEEQIDLWRYLKSLYGHVSYERILSGPGIYILYKFLIESGREKPIQEVVEKLAEDNPSKIIAEYALNKACPACIHTMKIFTYIYGSEAGNVALKFLATAGVYIGGGIAPKIAPLLTDPDFMKGFLAKGRFMNMLEAIPVKVILDENAALLGAIRYAIEKK
ncbi:MAG: glucokinase [Chlamydiae bacterium]|nr:glucokinase [Chlamydiota bacterium]